MNQFTSPAPEPIYQPLSEQKPNFSNQNVSVPEPTNVIPNNTFVEPSPVGQPAPSPSSMQNMNYSQPMPTNQYNMNNMTEQFSQNPNVIPSPVPNASPMPSYYNNPVPASPIPTPEPSTIPSPIMGQNQPQVATQPTNPQPVNFVYGPQQPNNNNINNM